MAVIVRKIDYNLAFRYLNDVCFRGELSQAKIHCFKGAIWSSAGALLVGAYHEGSREILLHTGGYVEKHQGGALEALYHEMVHQYIDELYDEPWDASPHGALFYKVYENGLKKLSRKVR